MSIGTTESYFATKVYRVDLVGGSGKRLLNNLLAACGSLAEDDKAGRAWCRENSYAGYTSYASLNDLPSRCPEFADLKNLLDIHVGYFARELEFDLAGRRLVLDSLWINVLPQGGYHTAHIHPHSVVSGTFYVAMPTGASAIKFEDPRLAMMMAAPPRKPKARRENRTFATVEPRPGTLLLWESWLARGAAQSRKR